MTPAAYGEPGRSFIGAGYTLYGGTVTGGTGGNGGFPNSFGGSGGNGVDVVAATLINQATIVGGTGGNAGSEAGGGQHDPVGRSGGPGGDGVDVVTGSVINAGEIAGSGGGSGNQGHLGRPGIGGPGVHIAAGSLSNYGRITGGSGPSSALYVGGVGVDLAGGSLTNFGTITGGAGFDGSAYGAGANVVGGVLINDATIMGGSGGSSAGSGTISGAGGMGVRLNGGTLVDEGFIVGGSGDGGVAAAIAFGNAASRLIVVPGAPFSGAIVPDGPSNNVLELATDGHPQYTPALFRGLGDTVNGFGIIQFDPDATWVIAGNAAGLAAGQQIDGFGTGDGIVLTGFNETGYSYTGAGLVLSGTAGPVTIGVQGSFATSDFYVSNGTFGRTIATFIAIAPPCFAAGTRISTKRGEIAVEALRPGDEAEVLHSDDPAPVVWIGHRVVNCVRHPEPRTVWPVRIAAGAFGRGLPCRDLWLSPDHAVFAAGVLIPVKYLINGASIAQVPMDAVRYYHVELSRHSVLLAEGLPTESYLDTDDRASFANGGACVTLFADFATRAWEAAGCAPLIVTATELDAVRERVNAIAATSEPTDGQATIAA